MNISKIQDAVTQFVNERDWDQFHSPKNLSMALAVEAAELMELFQWQTDNDFKNIDQTKISDEVSDIFFYLIRLSQKLNIDLEKSFFDKLKKNIIKYPVNISKGSNAKR
jgi:NTP pyrophosphatase (non-canonical NTP hydrolase)